MLSHMLRAASPTLVGNLTATYIGTTQTNSTNTTHTLNSVNIGTANLFRRVVVAVGTVGTGAGDTIDTVTVNGASLTKHTESSGAVGIAIFSAIIKSGGTATIVVTTSGNSNIAAHVFTVDGATSSFSGGSSNNSSTGTTVATSNLSVTANDVGIFVASQQSATAVSEAASTGALSESVDTTFTASATRRTAAGRVTYNSSSSTATVTLTGDSGILKRIALAVFTSP